MVSKFVREQQPLTRSNLYDIFECNNDEELNNIIKRLRRIDLLKILKKEDADKDTIIFTDTDVLDDENDTTEYIYKFSYVGILILFNKVLKVFPKYISSTKEPNDEFKQVIKVIEKFDKNDKLINLYNDYSDSGSLNLLAVMIYLLRDYFENGEYTNERIKTEVNGKGEILWDKTVNDAFGIVSNNRPYYTELYTKHRINDEYDYFRMLHRYILTKVSKELQESGLNDTFDLGIVELSDDTLDIFGDIETVLYRIQKELMSQFNTRKQTVLKLIYAYIKEEKTLNDNNGLSVYGTKSFYNVWEKICASVFDNKLHTKISNLDIKVDYEDKESELIKVIEKPKWSYPNEYANDTLIPDIVSIESSNNDKIFVIVDAKYYVPYLEKGKTPANQPGIESVAKQFLYQKAFSKYIKNINIRNCFVFPTEGDNVINKGYVSMDMFSSKPLELSNIDIRFMPATMVYEAYLSQSVISINSLNI